MLPIYHPHFRSAMKLIDEAQYAEAARQVNELAAELSGTDRASALYWKGVCLVGLGRIDDAMACVQDALAEVGPDSGLGICLQLLMASYLQRNEQREARIAAIRSVLSRYARRFSTPDFLWLYVDAKSAVGRTLLRLGKYSEGTAELEQALSMEPRPAARYRARVWLQSAYYKSGDLNKAKEHLENALKDADSAAKFQLPVDHPAQVRYELALIAYKQHRLPMHNVSWRLRLQSRRILRRCGSYRSSGNCWTSHNSERRSDS
jgi:tetratricopeptide (TPR) repeat protein